LSRKLSKSFLLYFKTSSYFSFDKVFLAVQTFICVGITRFHSSTTSWILTESTNFIQSTVSSTVFFNNLGVAVKYKNFFSQSSTFSKLFIFISQSHL